MPLRRCSCGCDNLVPEGIEFLSGHHVHYAHLLRERARAGDRAAFNELYSRGWKFPIIGLSPRAFGVEVEFFGMDQDSAAEILTSHGIPTWNEGYHHHRRKYWRVTDDGSVSQEGCELVSPALPPSKESLNKTHEAVTVLLENGGRVDSSCGLHIHHNAKLMNPHLIAETVGTWAMFQPVINKLLPLSRRENSYALPLSNVRTWYDRIMNYSTLAALTRESGRWGRYHAVNLNSLKIHGSIEFRQHNGTLNGRKITSWTEFTKCFMNIGKHQTLSTLLHSDNVTEEYGVKGMLDYIKASSKIKHYYLAREQLLLKVVEKRDKESVIVDRVWCHDCDAYHRSQEYNNERELDYGPYDEEPYNDRG